MCAIVLHGMYIISQFQGVGDVRLQQCRSASGCGTGSCCTSVACCPCVAIPAHHTLSAVEMVSWKGEQQRQQHCLPCPADLLWCAIFSPLACAAQLIVFSSVWTRRVHVISDHNITSAGAHISVLYLWQITILRASVLQSPAMWLGLFVISDSSPLYDLIPQVRFCISLLLHDGPRCPMSHILHAT